VDFIINTFFFANPDEYLTAERSLFEGIITELQGRVYNVAVCKYSKKRELTPWDI